MTGGGDGLCMVGEDTGWLLPALDLRAFASAGCVPSDSHVVQGNPSIPLEGSKQRDFVLSFCVHVLVEMPTEQWGHMWAMGARCPQSSLLFLWLL